MSESDWIDDDNGDWVDDEPTQKISQLESGLRGAAQGASLGFADEITGGLESLFSDKTYEQARNESRANYDASKKANPGTYATGEIGGGLATALVPGANIAKGASLAKSALQAGALGGLTGAGYSEADNAKDLAIDTAKGAGIGAGLGAAAQKVSPYISKGINKIGSVLGDKAEALAVNATGATGKQASEFADDAGRQLLDRKLVRFGDTPEMVAQRTSNAMDEAGNAIDTALKTLDEKGVTASADNIQAALKQKIDELRLDPSQAGLVKKLEGIVENIAGTRQANVPISAAEQTKRGFNKMAGNWVDPEVGQAGKQAYLSYMDEVERAANAADPNLANMFKEGKETYGLLAPIQEAAERRGLTQSQSPFGGLGDLAAIGSGGAAGGPVGAVAGLVGKKYLAPRATASAAVGLDKISSVLKKSPQMENLFNKNPQVFNAFAKKMEEQMGSGRVAENLPQYDQNAILEKTKGSPYAKTLQDAALRGQQAFNAAHFVLQSKDPNYRKLTVDPEGQQDEQ